MVQRTRVGSTSPQSCWFYTQIDLNEGLCSLIYQRCSRSSSKYFLWAVLRNAGCCQGNQTLGLFWCERVFHSVSPSHTQFAAFCLEATFFFFLNRFYCACRSRWANSTVIVITAGSDRRKSAWFSITPHGNWTRFTAVADYWKSHQNVCCFWHLDSTPEHSAVNQRLGWELSEFSEHGKKRAG